MTALQHELGSDVMSKAYFAFAQRYFDHSAALDEDLVDYVLRVVGAQDVSVAALSDSSLDAAVAKSHQRSQDALGDTGGSPLVTIDGRTVFGPVFTAVPAADETLAVFDAVATLVRAPEFSQLNRPRTH